MYFAFIFSAMLINNRLNNKVYPISVLFLLCATLCTRESTLVVSCDTVEKIYTKVIYKVRE